MQFHIAQRLITSVGNVNQVCKTCIIKVTKDYAYCTGVWDVARESPIIDGHMGYYVVENNLVALCKRKQVETVDGKLLKIRQSTEAEDKLSAIYNILGGNHTPLGKIKSVVHLNSIQKKKLLIHRHK